MIATIIETGRDYFPDIPASNLLCKYDTIHKTNITVEGLDNLQNE